MSGDCFALVVHDIDYLSSSLSSQFDDKLPEVQQLKSEIQMMEGNLQPLIEELDSKNLEVKCPVSVENACVEGRNHLSTCDSIEWAVLL